MIKAKKLLALAVVALALVGHCAAKTMTTEQAAQARKDIVAQAKQYIGCPYRSGAIGKYIKSKKEEEILFGLLKNYVLMLAHTNKE